MKLLILAHAGWGKDTVAQYQDLIKNVREFVKRLGL